MNLIPEMHSILHTDKLVTLEIAGIQICKPWYINTQRRHVYWGTMIMLLKLQINIKPLAYEFFTRNLLYFKFNCIDVSKEGFLDLQKTWFVWSCCILFYFCSKEYSLSVLND